MPILAGVRLPESGRYSPRKYAILSTVRPSMACAPGAVCGWLARRQVWLTPIHEHEMLVGVVTNHIPLTQAYSGTDPPLPARVCYARLSFALTRTAYIIQHKKGNTNIERSVASKAIPHSSYIEKVVRKVRQQTDHECMATKVSRVPCSMAC